MQACEESVSEVWKASSWKRSRERGEVGGSLPRHLSSVKGSSVELNRCRRAVKPFTWSKHTLHYSPLSTGAASMLRSLPSCPSAFPPFFSPSDEGFLPAKTLPLISWSVCCGAPLTKQLNDPSSTLTLLCLLLLLAAHSQICQHSVNASSSLCTSKLLIPWKGAVEEVALSGARPDGSFSQLLQHEGALVFLDFLSPPTTEMVPDRLIVVVH